jgi:hypothetical protein
MHSLPLPDASARLPVTLFLVTCLGPALVTGCARNAAPPPSAKDVAIGGAATNQPPNAVRSDNATPASTGEISLFDGKTLTGWAVTDFAGHGDVRVEDGKLILGSGIMTGVTWTNDLPRTNYEISLEAMRVEGNDFFCGLTFPVGDDPCSLIVGGWGGGVVGLSSLDGEDAAHNQTTQYMNFDNGRWFKIRLRVTSSRIQAWIDNDKVADLDTTGHKISIRVEVEPSQPLGFATCQRRAPPQHPAAPFVSNGLAGLRARGRARQTQAQLDPIETFSSNFAALIEVAAFDREMGGAPANRHPCCCHARSLSLR